MLFALKIHSHGYDQTRAPKVLTIDDQGQDVGRDRPLAERTQFGLRQRFPVPAHTGSGDTVALEAIINGSGIVACGNLTAQVSADGLLQRPLLLEGFISGQSQLGAVFLSHAGFINPYLAAGKDDIARLAAVAIRFLLAASSAQSADLLIE